MRTFDTIVVGAGPAGATTACLLARAGYDVALLDRQKFPRDKACGEFMNPAACDRTQDVFGITRTDLIAAGGTPVSQIRLQLRRRPALDIPMTDATGSPVSGVSLRRISSDSMFVQRCRDAGVSVFEGHNVRSAKQVGTAVVVSGDGVEPFEFRSRIILAADGTHSVIARQLGLTVPRTRLRSIGVVAHLRGLEPDTDFDSKVWMFPSSGDGLMFGFASQRGGSAVLSGSVPRRFARSLAANPEQFIRSWIAQHQELSAALSDATIDHSIRTTACFGHSLRQTFADGMLFLGDAARFSDPFTGEGIHHAVESGMLASQTAIAALSIGDTSASALSAYEVNRAELSSRYSLCEIVREVCLRPRLLDYVGARLSRHPVAARTLIGAIVDVLPPRSVLSPGFALRAMLP